MKIIRRSLFFSIAFIICSAAFGQVYQLSVDLRVPFAPAVTTINGQPTIYYELHITNFSGGLITLRGIDILDAADRTLVASKDPGTILAPGNAGIVYLEVVLPQRRIPLQLYHRCHMEIAGDSGKRLLIVQGADLQLPQQAPVVLGPPLAGGPWAAIYDPSWQRGHRRVIYTVDGKARIPGRWAIDLIKLDSAGRYAGRNEDSVRNWYGYGADVLAVADGVVAAVRNDAPESPTLSGYVESPPGQAAGNYVALDLGNGQFAFYEHLQPGSVRVKTGQRVREGAVIAALGFTGQTTGPHLHFHVADGNSPLGAEGMPYTFRWFRALGVYPDLGKFGKVIWAPLERTASSQISREHPAPLSVIAF